MSKKTMGEKLSAWFATQNKFKSWEALARFTGIPSGTLAQYRKGTRTMTSQNHREALFKATGMVEFRSPPEEGQITPPSLVPSSGVSSARTGARRILQLLLALKRELDFFAKGSPADRKELTRVVKGQDVGYIMALFKALYNEDQFQRWVLHTSYELQRNETP